MKEIKRKLNIKVLISIILFIVLLVITIWFATQIYQEKQIANNLYNTQKIDTSGKLKKQSQISNIQEDEHKQNPIEKDKNQHVSDNIIKEYNGYTVEAKLDIPAISLETYVLKNYSIQALNVSVTKFWGASANEVGNFCIAGHNFKNKMMFHNLKKLKLGDIIYLTDNKNGKLSYKIYDIYSVLPQNVDCLSQKTNGIREITLITCTNDSVKRIIVKAKE